MIISIISFPGSSLGHFQLYIFQLKPTLCPLLANIFRNPHLPHSGKFLCGNTRGLWAEMVEETVVKPMSWVHTSQLQQSQVSHNYHLYLLTKYLNISRFWTGKQKDLDSDQITGTTLALPSPHSYTTKALAATPHASQVSKPPMMAINQDILV